MGIDDATKGGGGADRTSVLPTMVGSLSASASGSPALEDLQRPVIPGYELLRPIGRGGMGVVWEAIELRLERHVALKVHRVVSSSEVTEASHQALSVEALVAARIGDPSIVRVFDVGLTLDNHPYYAMELVQGTDLASIMADGPLPPRKAVAFAVDIARAAAAAHRHGVIHRDLKPRNVIVDGEGRARVVDFGIAWDRRRGEDPYAGQLAGSPPYMAPEQVLGHSIVPQTDIHAIGVMLYEMLTGERPFVGATSLDELFAQIIAVDPPPPSTKRAGLHGDLDLIVLRCLMKDPAARFPTAGVLFETLTAVLEGQKIDPVVIGGPAKTVSYVPKASGTIPSSLGGRVLPTPQPSKPLRSSAKKHLSWSWRLESSYEKLWPYVADTDRFNKAVGLAPVTFSDEVRPDGIVRRTGEIRVLGLQVSWREYPFEWIKNREHSVFRWYTAGPIAALWNRVTLKPLPDGQTELTHDIWLSPRGVIGQVAAFVEIDRKLAPAIGRFYRHLDTVVNAGAMVDPFEASHTPTPEQREIVDTGCRRLHGEGFEASIVEKLAMLLLSAPTGTLGSLRPFALADQWHTDRAETMDAFIHAARIGLLEPAWDVVCPRCMIAHESLDDLQHLTRHGSCTTCATSFERDLGESVELVFAPHPSVRTIERLTFCAGSPAKRPHVIVQQLLEPGEERILTVDLPRGTYRLAGQVAKGKSSSYEIVASAVGFEETLEVVATNDKIEATPSIVAAGTLQVILKNHGSNEETFRIEAAGLRDDAVSAAAALTHPSFRSFFSTQLLAHGEHLRVRHLAFLFVELIQRETLFDTVGDGAVCAELARLDEMVAEEARLNEGDIVPSSMSLFIVAFPTSARAFRAALSLREKLRSQFSSPVAIALHDGRCIALTRAGKPEFFGETLHRGQALLQDCPEGGIALSASVVSDRAVALAAQECAFDLAVDKTQDGPYAGRRVTLLMPHTSQKIL